nr:MAG TPA: hypothetical protein [Caudoviricetes sp.]
MVYQKFCGLVEELYSFFTKGSSSSRCTCI